MTDDEVYTLCSTEKGCLEYIEYACEYFGTGWVALELKRAPILQKLLDDGVIQCDNRHGVVWYRKQTNKEAQNDTTK